MSDDLFESIVNIAEEYIGPPAKRFMSRQIISHLQKDPNEIVLSDIPLLADWTRITVALLTEDKEMVESFIQRLLKLSEPDVGVKNGS